ncbi:MAG: tetratricopeptide repeat protein, partial [Turicibacter sp.]|nr:tetratricopeptide repeat protein [Turicibacter sp.]
LLVADETQRLAVELTLAYFLLQQNKLNDGYLQLIQTKKSLASLHEPALLAECLSYEFLLFSRLNLHSNALDTLDTLEIIATKNNLSMRLAMAFQNKGRIYSQLQEYEKAIEYHKKGLELVKGSIRYGPLLISLISCHLQLKNLVEARAYLAFTNEHPFSEKEEVALINLRAQLALYLGDFHLHQKYLDTAIEYYSTNNHQRDLAYIYGYLADYHTEKEDYKMATFFYKKERELKL